MRLPGYFCFLKTFLWIVLINWWLLPNSTITLMMTKVILKIILFLSHLLIGILLFFIFFPVLPFFFFLNLYGLMEFCFLVHCFTIDCLHYLSFFDSQIVSNVASGSFFKPASNITPWAFEYSLSNIQSLLQGALVSLVRVVFRINIWMLSVLTATRMPF